MANRTYTVYEFAALTPFQKERLRERDPQQYEQLMQKLKRELPDVNEVSKDDITLRD